MELNSSNAGGREVGFTRREIEVLNLASGGLSNKVIADKLGNAETTVKRHRQNIMRKVGIVGKPAMTVYLMSLK